MKNPFKKKRDDLAKARKTKANTPYRQCGHQRSYIAKGGSRITVICSKNANVKHKHD